MRNLCKILKELRDSGIFSLKFFERNSDSVIRLLGTYTFNNKNGKCCYVHFNNGKAIRYSVFCDSIQIRVFYNKHNNSIDCVIVFLLDALEVLEVMDYGEHDTEINIEKIHKSTSRWSVNYEYEGDEK